MTAIPFSIADYKLDVRRMLSVGSGNAVEVLYAQIIPMLASIMFVYNKKTFYSKIVNFVDKFFVVL